MGRTIWAHWAELNLILKEVDLQHPRASLMTARIVMALLRTPDRTMRLSDLTEAIDRGRDSTAVRSAVLRLTEMGILRRELESASARSGRAYLVHLPKYVANG